MTDIDRYLTDEAVEEAAVAIQLVISIDAETRLVYLPEYENLPDGRKRQRQHEARRALEAVLPDIIRRAKAEALEEGDGYHTHEELYEYRMLYNAHAARGWLAAGIPVVKSWRHSDGELCFGGGWFVVYADLPAGQVSNHYKAEFWGLFDVPEVDLAPEYDGHTPAEAAERLRADLIWQGAAS